MKIIHKPTGKEVTLKSLGDFLFGHEHPNDVYELCKNIETGDFYIVCGSSSPQQVKLHDYTIIEDERTLSPIGFLFKGKFYKTIKEIYDKRLYSAVMGKEKPIPLYEHLQEPVIKCNQEFKLLITIPEKHQNTFSKKLMEARFPFVIETSSDDSSLSDFTIMCKGIEDANLAYQLGKFTM